MRQILFHLIKHKYENEWKYQIDCILKPLQEKDATANSLAHLLLLFDIKALDLCSSKIDKLSGDLRSCFQIMHQTIQDKLKSVDCLNNDVAEIVSAFKLTPDDVNQTCDRMFESKVNKLIAKLPRSHVLVLRCVEKWYLEKQKDSSKLSETTLLSIFNTYIVREMSVERININQLFELCSYLRECNVLEVLDKSMNKSNKPLELTKRRTTGSKAIGKSFYIELKVDI